MELEITRCITPATQLTFDVAEVGERLVGFCPFCQVQVQGEPGECLDSLGQDMCAHLNDAHGMQV